MLSLKIKQPGAFPDASEGAQWQVLLGVGYRDCVQAITMDKNVMTARYPIQYPTRVLQFLDQ
jgi:hypothetical protein